MPISFFHKTKGPAEIQYFPLPVITSITGGGLIGLQETQSFTNEFSNSFTPPSVLLITLGDSGHRIADLWLKKIGQIMDPTQISNLRILSVFQETCKPKFPISENSQLGMHVFDNHQVQFTRQSLYSEYVNGHKKEAIKNLFIHWINQLSNFQVWIVGSVQEPIITLVPYLISQLYTLLGQNQHVIDHSHVLISLDPASPATPLKPEMMASLLEICRLSVTSDFHQVSGLDSPIIRNTPLNEISLFCSNNVDRTDQTIAEGLFARFMFPDDVKQQRNLIVDDKVYINTFKAAVIETPVDELCNYYSARLSKDLLSKLFHYKTDIENQQCSQIDYSIIKHLHDFEKNPLANCLINGSHNSLMSLQEESLPIFSKAFMNEVGQYLINGLNQNTISLIECKQQLEQLKTMILSSRQQFSDKKIIEVKQNWIKCLESAIESLNDWISGSVLTNDTSTIIPNLIEQNLTEHLNKLVAMQSGSICRSISSLDVESYYTNYIFSEKLVKQENNSVFSLGAKRIGWWVNLDDQNYSLKLQLVCIPHNSSINSNKQMDNFAFSIERFVDAQSAIFNILKESIRQGVINNLETVIGELESEEKVFLYTGAEPDLVKNTGNLVPKVIIYGPTVKITQEVHEFNGFLTLPDTATQELHPAPWLKKRIGVVSFWEKILMESTPIIASSLKIYHQDQGEKGHVQQLEKNAVAICNKITQYYAKMGKVRSSFTLPLSMTLMAQNQRGMELFVLAWYKKIIRPINDENHIPYWTVTKGNTNYLELRLSKYDEKNIAGSLFEAMKEFCLTIPSSMIQQPDHPFYHGNIESFYDELFTEIRSIAGENITEMLKVVKPMSDDYLLTSFTDYIGAILNEN